MKNILKNLGLLLLSSGGAYLLSPTLGSWYEKIFKDHGGWVNLSSLIGLPLAYIFFFTLLFTAFGGAKKYWWIGIALIPAVLFEVYFDLQHLYFPIAIGLVAWLVGKGVALLVEKK